MISLDDVHRAREAIAGRLHRTPTFTSASLSQRSGAQVHLKAELFQRTGSFKPRGVLTKLASLTPEEKSRGVIGISAGNHAQALAYCSALEGIDALLVMWQGARRVRSARRRSATAPTVHQEARDPTEAFAVLDAAARRRPAARSCTRSTTRSRRPAREPSGSSCWRTSRRTSSSSRSAEAA